MKREDLKTMGLTDDQIESVMMAYGKELNPLKEQINSLTSERDSLKQQVVDRDGQLDDLRKNAGENDDLKATIKQLQDDNKAAEAKYKSDLAAKESALRDAKAKNVKAVISLLDTEKVSVGKDGTLDGLTDQLDALKQSDGYLFEQTEQPGRINIGGKFGNDDTPQVKDDVASRIAERFAKAE